jgi:hypothetical protein
MDGAEMDDMNLAGYFSSGHSWSKALLQQEASPAAAAAAAVDASQQQQQQVASENGTAAAKAATQAQQSPSMQRRPQLSVVIEDASTLDPANVDDRGASGSSSSSEESPVSPAGQSNNAAAGSELAGMPAGLPAVKTNLGSLRKAKAGKQVVSPRRAGKPSALMGVLQSPRAGTSSLSRSSRQLGTSRSSRLPLAAGAQPATEELAVAAAAAAAANVSSSGGAAAAQSSGNSNGSGSSNASGLAAESSNPMLQSLAKVKANRVFRRSDSRVAAGAVDALLNSLTAPSPSRVAGPQQQQQQYGARKPRGLPGVAAALQWHNIEGRPAASFFDWDNAAVPGSHSYSGSGCGSGAGGGFCRGTSHHSVSDGGAVVGPKHWPLAGELGAVN